MTGFLAWLSDCIPTWTEVETGSMVAAVGGTIGYLCGWGQPMEALCVLMVIDYMTGMLAAYINPNMKLDSRKGFRGIAKKVMILLLISLAHFVDLATGQTVAQIIAIWFFLGNEGLSILENAANAGLPVPNKLRETLEQLSKEKGADRPGKEK
ncbi:phage holin family protein [Selenomonas noxia]|uniref:phage holin family protein n=1 Tax=Selenomonas noxia TaxID=135083 RepID=UPI00204F20EB|nr:phage holin family protein [Selenomonas noxia]DAV45995.1 MAG TPA: holin [Caudoviricetes sp.]DAX27923.1 MAG TPA: holin [Caudoviricetes sp.]